MLKELIVLMTLAVSTPIVIDGDTIKSGGILIRLIDYNTPELSAPCPKERALAARARLELKTLLPRLRFELRTCATHNYGRLCMEGYLKTDEGDEIPLAYHMTSQGFAEPYICTDKCPKRRSWC
jgi:endonuclease YncB( thermonuclease family)